MKDIFDKQKQACLAGVDLSRKGSIDAPIVKLTEVINDHCDLFTLSSCSGRIVMLREADDRNTVRKAGCDWLCVSHTELDPNEAVTIFSTRDVITNGCVVIKFEPFVLHVQCRHMSVAKQVLDAATKV